MTLEKVMIEIDGDFYEMPESHQARIYELAETASHLHAIQAQIMKEYGVRYAIVRVLSRMLPDDVKDAMRARNVIRLKQHHRRIGFSKSSVIEE